MATSLGKVGIRNRGRFDASATYAAGEYVYYMGSTFIALQNLPAGMVPQHDGINWNFLAEGASVEQVLQNFAPIEDGATVSQAYSAGSYLLHEDILYKTITDIASGGAIIIGTNITPVTIGEEMHSLAKNFANEEDSAVATMNYSVGQYLVYNEQFYKVTAAISAGQTLVPGTNIEATNVGAQLSALSDALTYNQVQTGISGVSAYKMGHIVTLVFNITNLSVTANAWNNVCTLPSALYPKQYLQSISYDGQNNKAIEFNIYTDGLVKAYFFDASVYFRTTITYISND